MGLNSPRPAEVIEEDEGRQANPNLVGGERRGKLLGMCAVEGKDVKDMLGKWKEERGGKERWRGFVEWRGRARQMEGSSSEDGGEIHPVGAAARGMGWGRRG